MADDRGKVSFWNFLPPDELNALLSLYKHVTEKALRISRPSVSKERSCSRPKMTTRRCGNSTRHTRVRGAVSRTCGWNTRA